MNEIKFIIRLLGIPIKIGRKIPSSIVDLSERQYLTLVRYMNGQIKEHRLIARMYNLPGFLARIISYKKFWIYKLIETMETFTDFSRPLDRFVITRISDTNLCCVNRQFKGISFMQFMFADTMYTQYLKSQKEGHLYSFIATLYLKPDEQFFSLNLEERIEFLSQQRIDSIVFEAILLNYMMMKKWLAEIYPFMFSSLEKNGASSYGHQQNWLDIFDAFVGEQIPDTEYYKKMPCMDAFRIINRRMKNYLNGAK